MSDDLISRSATIDFIKKSTQGYHPQGYKTAVLEIINLIEQVDAAYDVDKVVEQLEEKIENTADTQIGISARMAFGKAIEIVKESGVNE